MGSAIRFQQSGYLQQAEEIYRKILREQPYNAQAYFVLGSIRRTKGQLDDAIVYFQKAIELNPEYGDAYTDLGSALQAKGQIDRAINYYQKALELNPEHGIALYNLGSAFHEKGHLENAILYYQRALKSNPDALAYNNLGSAFVQKGLLGEAVDCYQKAVQINPTYAHAYYNLGTALREQSKPGAAVAAYDEVIRIDPNNMAARLARCISQLPIIYPDQQSIQICRDRYFEELTNLIKTIDLKNRLHIEAAATAIGTQQPFYLAYQGLNDRDLQRLYGDLVCRIMASRYPQFANRPAMPDLQPGERLRVGIVSGHFYQHSVWKIIMRGWLENVAGNRFSLYGYYTGKTKDGETEAARKCCARFVEDTSSFEELCRVIRGDDLHALIYPEIGMDAMTVRLASLWLAPLQCNSWGHPDSSGFPTIDYYLSSDLMEPADAGAHYTESLVRLPNLSVCYTPLGLPDTSMRREDFGLSPRPVMYLCCQSVFKYLPQYDEVYPRIAREAGDCRFLFISFNNSVTEKFRSRLDRAFKRFDLNAEEYVFFLPRLDSERYHAINRLSDIYLDSIGWSGGNTTLEAIAGDLPVVTLPGELMRGRHTFAILMMMGITDLIASSVDEYIAIAVRLAKDVEWRKSMSEKIMANKHRIYRDKACITALEDFIERAVKTKLETALK